MSGVASFPSFAVILVVVSLCIVASVDATVNLTYDIVVYGASPAGIGAAVAAASRGYRVALLEETSYVGGMAGPGGIGLRDIATPDSFINNTVIRTWLALNNAYYNSSGPVWQPDASVAEANWWKVLARPGLDVFTNVGLFEGPSAVTKVGTTITSIQTVDTLTEDPTNITVWYAKQFVDASYGADIVLAGGIPYTYGRESNITYGEKLAGVLQNDTFAQFSHPVNPYWPNGTLLFGVEAGPIPAAGSADNRVMPSSYRACVTDSPGQLVAWPAPAGYNEGDFELLIRYVNSLLPEYPNGPPISKLVSQLTYNGYPANAARVMKYDLCETGGSSVSTDEPWAIYDDWITGNRSIRAQVAASVKYFVSGMMYTLANSPAVPNGTRQSTRAWGLCKDAWTSSGNWPPLLYVREGVRLVGDVVTTQNTLVRGAKLANSVGIGGWTIDIHIMRRFAAQIDNQLSALNEGGVGFAQLPGSGPTYELPYTLLLPQATACTNLLAPLSPSASHVAFGSIRVEPTFLQMGTASGMAAALAIQYAVPVQEVPIGELQAALLAFGQCVHWPGCS